MKALLDLDQGDYDNIYLEPGFLRMVSDHRHYLANLSSTNKLPLEPADSYRWRGDFYGLLRHNGVSPNHCLPLCIVNGLSCYSDWDGETDVLIMPSESEINKLLEIYITSKN